MTVIARKKDDELVRQAAEAAAKSYSELSGREIKYEVEATLSDDGCVFIVPCFVLILADCAFSAGGIKLANGSRRITIDNTLDERLRLLEDRVCSCVFPYYPAYNAISDAARDQKGPVWCEREP